MANSTTNASFLLQPPQRVHGVSPGCKYAPPQIDGSLPVPEIYDWHYKNSPTHPVFAYPAGSKGEINELTFSQVVPAAHRAAHLVSQKAGIDLSTTNKRPLVAVLANIDMITYFTLILGMMRAAIPVFPLNPRFTEEAFQHLILATRPTYVLVGKEPEYLAIVDRALSLLKETDPDYKLEIYDIPTYEELYSPKSTFEQVPTQKYDLSYPAVITTSSGSTSLPKPIVWNPRLLLQIAVMPHFGSHDFCGKRFAAHGIPMYISIGVNFISWLSGTGFVIATFPPGVPPPAMTPESIFHGFREARVDYVVGITSFVEKWSRDSSKVEFLSSIDGVVYGGSVMNVGIGNFLSDSGVNIYTLYGMTEVGVIGNMFPHSLGGHEWEYITINPHCAAHFVPTGDGAYELFILSKPTHEITVQCDSEFDGVKALATKDLLVPHPTQPGYWKLLGRAVDQILLSSGVKVTTRPLEDALNHSPKVLSSVCFGQGRNCIGVLIQLTGSDEYHVSQTMEELWHIASDANLLLPEEGRLKKDMILFTKPEKPFSFTLKGLPNRRKVLLSYEKEINELYNAV
ncbi:hypothetical protein BDQ17DRAFT_1360041 [Cyathus striatus]|nr:hypothetical protein BDQ17DRAFT_1360041 [Cyathus striatus]